MSEETDTVEADKKSYQTFHNESDDGEQTYDVHKAIEHIGFGKYQFILIGLSGIAWIADGMEMTVIAIMGPSLVCDWGITKFQEALLTTCVFSGFAFGSWFFGYLGDRIGRRRSVMISTSCVSLFGILSAFAPNIYWMFAVRCLTGIGIGGCCQTTTYISEFVPGKYRGKSVLATAIFWFVGGALEVVLAMLLLVPYGWRVWLGVSVFPCVIFTLIGFFLPNSPHFDIIAGKTESAEETLRQIAKMNNKEVPAGRLITAKTEPRGQCLDMMSSGYRLQTPLLLVIWFIAAFTYYGLILLSTELILVGNTCDTHAFSSDVDTLTCTPLNMSNYTEMLWISLAELPGLILMAVLIDIIGRKISLFLGNLTLSISITMLFICMTNIPMVALLFIGRAMADGVFQVLFVYTAEVYPTQFRGLAVGLGSSCSRLGALSTPFVAQVLVSINLHYALAVYISTGLLASIVSLLLPYETKGKSLASQHS